MRRNRRISGDPTRVAMKGAKMSSEKWWLFIDLVFLIIATGLYGSLLVDPGIYHQVLAIVK